MNLYNIQRALVTTFNANIGIAKADENRKYTPVNGTPYAVAYFLPSGSDQRTVGASGVGKIEHFGIFQITLKYPVNTGYATISQKADSIASNEFKVGSLHTYSGDTVRITKVEREQAINEDGWHTLPISIYWQNYEARP